MPKESKFKQQQMRTRIGCGRRTHDGRDGLEDFALPTAKLPASSGQGTHALPKTGDRGGSCGLTSRSIKQEQRAYPLPARAALEAMRLLEQFRPYSAVLC